MSTEEIKTILECDAEYTSEKVENMTQFELLDAYLEWEGIIGYTHDIITVVASVFGIDYLYDMYEY